MSKKEVIGDPFVLEWYVVFNWEEDPFKDVILKPVNYFISGYDKERERINSFVIKKERFGSITGDKGVGKTIILKWLEYELEKYKSNIITIYINCQGLHSDKDLLKEIIGPLLNLNEKLLDKFYSGLNLGNLLKEVKHEPKFINNLFSKPFLKLDKDEIINFIDSKLKNNRMVLLLDDARFLSKNDIILLEKIINSNLNMQIIISDNHDNIKKTGLTTRFKDELKVELKDLSSNAQRDLIKKRIEFYGGKDITPFLESHFKEICSRADTPRNLLKVCYDYCVKNSLKEIRKIEKKPIEVKPEPKPVENKKVKEKDLEVKEEKPKEYEVKPVVKENKKEYVIKVVQPKEEKSDYKIKKIKR